MSGPLDFTNENIENTYQRVLQTDGTLIYDGTGSLFTVTAVASPAGPNQSVQFNDAGATSGSGTFTFNKNTNVVNITGSIIASSGFTGSLLGMAATASFTPNAVVTASINSNTITFTKGDGSTFPLTVNTGSGGTSTPTSSLLTTASANLNQVTFTKGDGSQFTITVDTGSGGTSTPTGSLLVTASATLNQITFTKGDTSQFTITVDTGSGTNINTSSFVTTSSFNTFTGSYNTGSFTGSFIGSLLGTAATASNTPNAVITGSVISNILTFTKGDGSSFNLTVNTGSGGGPSTNTGSLLVTASATLNQVTFTKGDTSQFTITIDTGSGGTSTPTGSLLVTASANLNIITFTKGDGSTFPVTINTGSSSPIDTSSFVTTSSFNSFTASYNTGSFTGSFTGVFNGTASWAFSASQAISASYALSSSFATTASYVNTLRATGSNGQIQYNNNGLLGASSNLTYNGNLIVFNDGLIYQGNTIYAGVIGPTGQKSANERGIYSEDSDGPVQYPIVSYDPTDQKYYFANYNVNYNPTNTSLTITGSLRVTGSTQGGGSGHILTYNTASGEVFFTASSAIGGGGGDISNLKSGSFGVTIDGNGGVITIGQKGYITVPYNGTITDWELFGDQAGTCTIDVRKSTFANFPTQTSITGSAPITVSPAAQKASSSILTGWTSSISAGDIYGFTLNTATGFTRLNLIINTIKSWRTK